MPRRRINRMTDLDWATYKNIINDFIDLDAGKQPFLWLRNINQPSAYGEDSDAAYSPVQLDGLFQYNYIRTWPSAKETLTGELDTGNTVLYISANLLRINRFLNQYGYWDYNWSEDRFILNGKVYKPSGDTQVAQAKDEALLFFVILQREDPEEMERILNSYAGQAQVVNNDGIWLVDSEGKTIRDFSNVPIKVQGPPDILPIKTSDGVVVGYTHKE